MHKQYKFELIKINIYFYIFLNLLYIFGISRRQGPELFPGINIILQRLAKIQGKVYPRLFEMQHYYLNLEKSKY